MKNKNNIFVIIALIVLIFSIFFIVHKLYKINRINNIELDAVSAIVFDRKNDKVLFGKEIDKIVYPGSITKLVSMFVVFDEIKNNRLSIDDEITVSQNAASTPASRVGLKPDETMTVNNLIKCVLIASGSDAMLALAEHISGTEEEFVKRMNEKVEYLGLKNTHFAGCIGMDNTKTYSTAHDIAVISTAITEEYPQIYDYTKLSYADIIRDDKSLLSITNTNDMLNIDGIDGLKTGSTPQSGYNLSMTYNKNGKQLVIVVLNCNTLYFRRQDCLLLVDLFS